MLIDVNSYKKIVKESADRDRLKIRQHKSEQISSYPFVESCTYNELSDDMSIVFNEPLETEGIDLEGLFTVGGVLKKSNGKDNEEGYLKVEPIG